MILDAVTGEPQQFGKHRNSIGPLDQALEYVRDYHGWEERFVIVKMQTIQAAKI